MTKSSPATLKFRDFNAYIVERQINRDPALKIKAYQGIGPFLKEYYPFIYSIF